MGNSAQDHRAVTGLYAGRLCSSSWAPCTGAFKVRGGTPDQPDSTLLPRWPSILLIAVVLLSVAQLGNLYFAHNTGVLTSSLPCPQEYGGTEYSVAESTEERTAGQIRMLLLLSGNVERNPGPNSSDALFSGLADLVGQAPPGMRDILCTWSPDKPANLIADELGSRKFTVAPTCSCMVTEQRCIRPCSRGI